MDYQITCVCGHRFLVSQDKIASHAQVVCPNCHQRLSPVIELPKPTPAPALAAPAADAPESSTAAATPALPVSSIPASAEETKRCPFCGEVILAVARKCKHCGEFLDRAHPDQPAPSTFPRTAAAAPATDPSTATPGANDIPPVFTLSVSQWDNFWKFLIILFLSAAVIAALWWIEPLRQYKEVATPAVLVFAAFIGWLFYLGAKNTRAYIRPFRIDTEEGILSKHLNSLEFFRIADIEFKQSLLERILGIGTVRLITTDADNPELLLYQIPKAREVYKYIQNQIPHAARNRGAIYMEK